MFDALEADDGEISVVNLAEVLEFGVRAGGSASDRLGELGALLQIEPVTEVDALVAAHLWPGTRRPSLSLGSPGGFTFP